MTGATGESLRVDRFVLPARDDLVLHHFLEHLFVAHSARERLWGWGARTSSRLGMPSTARRMLPISPPPAPASPAGTDEILPALRRIGLGRGARSIQLRDYPGGGRAGSVTFVFPPGAREPSVVVKSRPSAGSSAPSLRREWHAISELRDRLPADLRATVPEPLWYATENRTEVLALSFIAGCPAYADMRNLLAPARRAGSHMKAASCWLARFHEATTDPSAALDPAQGVPDPEWLRERIWKSGGPGGEALGPGLGWVHRLREDLARESLHPTAIHGDFWPRNLLLDRGGGLPGVVDWEHHRDRGNPAYDLFQFPITYGLNHPWVRYRRSPALDAFRRTFLERNRVSRAVRSYFEGYRRARGMEWSLLRRLFLLHLLTASPEEPWVAAYALAAGADQSVFSP